MTDIENYHNWLRDAHAMEKQAESLLVATIRRLDNEPQLRTRLEQHLYETRRQLSALQDIIARNHISRFINGGEKSRRPQRDAYTGGYPG